MAAPVVAGLLALSACGSGDEGATLPTLDQSTASTEFIVRPAPTTTTTLAPVVDDAEPSSPSDPQSSPAGPGEYTVQSGDFPLQVASDFGITLEQLVAANGWASADNFPTPGTVIQIPSPTAADDTDEVAAADDADEQEDTVATSGDECAARAYTIEPSDTSRLAVANKFDVTVDALDAANAATDGYNAFYPGLQIVIPASSDC